MILVDCTEGGRGMRKVVSYETVRGEVVPRNLDITVERAGTADRETAIRHVEKVMKLGYLPGDEAGKRVVYLKNAVTKNQIREALRDLPAMEGKRRRNLDDFTAVPMLTLIFLFVIFAFTAVLGGVLLGIAEPDPGIGMYLLTLPMLIGGITGAFTSTATMMAKLDT